jgi:hypothetical protein
MSSARMLTRHHGPLQFGTNWFGQMQAIALDCQWLHVQHAGAQSTLQCSKYIAVLRLPHLQQGTVFRVVDALTGLSFSTV